MSEQSAEIALTRDERNAVTAIVEREHRDAPMRCTCGAQIGDSIDRRWHLMNQTIAAVERVLAQRYRPEQIAATGGDGRG